MKSISKIVFAAALAGAAVVPAQAEEYTVVVSFADLDLTQPTDVDVLKERLNDALVEACGTPLSTSFAATEKGNSCVDDGMWKGRKLIAERVRKARSELPE